MYQAYVECLGSGQEGKIVRQFITLDECIDNLADAMFHLTEGRFSKDLARGLLFEHRGIMGYDDDGLPVAMYFVKCEV